MRSIVKKRLALLVPHRFSTAKQPVIYPETMDFQAQLAAALADNPVDGLDSVSDDEDLLNELNDLMSSGPPAKTQNEVVRASATAAAGPPLPAHSAETTSVAAKRSTPAPDPPPVPERRQAPPPAEEPKAKPESEADQVRKILKRRCDAYLLNLKNAEDSGDAANVREFKAMVEIFTQAIQVAAENDLSLADLEEVPGTPKPYRKKAARPTPKTLEEDIGQRYDVLVERAEKHKNAGEDAHAKRCLRVADQFKQALLALRKGRAFDVASLPPVAGLPVLADQPYTKAYVAKNPKATAAAAEPSQSTTPAAPSVRKPAPTIPKAEDVIGDSAEKNQLRFVISRRDQFRTAALQAKQAGDMDTAREMLLNAKKLEPMIAASQSGLPVDIRSVPYPPQSNVPKALMRQVSVDADQNIQNAEKALMSQINLCDSHRKAFNERNDSRSVLIFENLLTETKTDLLHFQKLVQSGQTPSVRIVQLTLPSLVVATEKDLAEDQLEIKILNIENLKLAEGYKVHHVAVYVKVTFNFPHETPQIGKTAIVSGTENPEFDEVINFKIDRKSRKMLRLVRRVPIKIEIFQKGGFLRSDKIWGSSDLNLAAFEKQTLITSCQDVLEGRRKTGGKLTVQARVCRPITEADTLSNNASSAAVSRVAAPTVTRKWVKVDH